ncbi:hypothetical protein N7460_012860 [Penicillium canescens]|uniref:Hydantoin racemase n=1 Tax=Penicillium canescens TaxID=5083 RepID=A0AAD6N1L8_PENCN|nr:hypothetical protein N7460_012860 [Penicillium canescens]
MSPQTSLERRYDVKEICTLNPRQGERKYSILIINPNTSTHMTEALKPILASMNYTDVHFEYFTAPDSPSSSALNCWSVRELVPYYDAFLVACYSAHPFVGQLRQDIKSTEENNPTTRNKYVTGIFEASITAALSLVSGFALERPINPAERLHKYQEKGSFGIVTTGSAWKDELIHGVQGALGYVDRDGSSMHFAGVETTGLTAIELHTTDPEEVRQRIVEATRNLLRDSESRVKVVCLGCAGMAGMEEAVREGCKQEYGILEGGRVRIVDGVVAGAGNLITALKAGF